MVYKRLKFKCYYCKSEFISTVYNIDEVREFKVICPVCDAVCVGILPEYDKIRDIDENKMEPLETYDPRKKPW